MWHVLVGDCLHSNAGSLSHQQNALLYGQHDADRGSLKQEVTLSYVQCLQVKEKNNEELLHLSIEWMEGRLSMTKN